MKKSLWIYALSFLLLVSCGGGDDDDNNDGPQREEDTGSSGTTGSTGTTGTTGSGGTTGGTSGSDGTTGGTTTSTNGTIPNIPRDDRRNACGIPLTEVQNILNLFRTLTNQRTFTGNLSLAKLATGTFQGNGTVVFTQTSTFAWKFASLFTSGGVEISRLAGTWEFKSDGCLYLNNFEADIVEAEESTFHFRSDIRSGNLHDTFELGTSPKLKWNRGFLNQRGEPEDYRYQLN